MTHIHPGHLAFALLIACLTFAGCGEDPKTNTTATSNAAPAGPSANTLEPGVISGTATTTDGRPLPTFAGDIGGYSLTSGKNVNASIDGAAGAYTTRVGPGQFSMRAWTDVEYNGRKYRIDLHPADGKPALHKYDTTAGLLKNFIWRLDGYRPGQDERSGDVDATYGGTLDLNPEGHGVQYWWDIKDDKQHKPEPKIDADATVEVTLTPDGPLIDGSTGKPIVLTIKPASIKAYMDRKRRGIPIGRYKATARAIAAKGSARALRITAYTSAVRNAETIPESAASATIEFPQSAPPSHVINRADEVIVHMMY
jgi:hypothetical protein